MIIDTVKLPYPLGTKEVFMIEDGDIVALDAEEITIRKTDISDIIIYTVDCYDFVYDDFGRIAFLSEDEAMKHLH